MEQRRLTDEQSAFVAANRWLAIRFAKNWHGSGHLDFDDRVSAAFMGLCRAALKYDPEKGEFSTIAYHWMRHFLTRGEKAQAMIHIPEWVGKPGNTRFVDAAHAARSCRSLPMDGRTIAAKEASSIDIEKCRTATEAVACLAPRTRFVIRRVVIHGDTLEATAREIGITKERVRQIKEMGLATLRRRLS